MNSKIVNSKYLIDNVFLSSDESDYENNICTSNIDIKNMTNVLTIINDDKSLEINNLDNLNNNLDSDSNKSESNKSDESESNKSDNGWDHNANKTINNWYNLFKQQSFIYQWILERNKNISQKLILVSIISSSTLGIFSGFKLWIKNDKFNTISDLLLMLSNFSIAFITSYSKHYTDDNRNELIRIYIDEVDQLLGEISAQILESPTYRVNAKKFFKEHNYKYTKLITNIPNISLYELNESKKKYEEFKKHFNINLYK